ncbi:hypothetical protein ACGFNP_11325 [Nonomuraea sp. NPDC049269]
MAWLKAMDQAGGAVVLVVDSHVSVDNWTALADGGKAQGGFVPTVHRTN